MRTSVSALVAACSLFLAGCAVFEPQPLEQERAAFARARQLWTSTGPSAYRYVFVPQCTACPENATRAVWVTVQDDAVTNVAWVDGGSTITSPYGYPTIDGLFAQLDSAYRAPVPSVRVRYDGTYGYPMEAVMTRVGPYTDGTYGFAASALVSLPSP